MWLELLTLVIGIAFGFLHKGKEDYLGILRNGTIIGILIGLLSVAISLYLAPGSGLAVNFPGIAGTVLVVLLYVVIMIVGAFIGDRLERIIRK